MADRPAPNAPDWRNKGTPSKAGAAGKRDWHTRPTTAAGPRQPLSKGTKVVIGFGALSVVTGLIVALIWALMPTPPGCLVLLGSPYDMNLSLPHNAYGWQGLKDLAATAKEASEPGLLAGLFGSGKLDVRGEGGQPVELSEKRNWEAELDALCQTDHSTVVVFLALHGGVDNGEPVLYADDQRTRAVVPLKQLLKRLKDHPSLDKKNVLLVLEPALAAANWPTGQLANEFVDKLVELRPTIEAEHPRFAVLCASKPKQVSWPSPVWRRTVFSHYLIEGLKGGADAAGDGNGFLTVGEWFAYVQKGAKDWALANRSLEQDPIFVGDEALKDVVLARTSTEGRAAVDALAKPPDWDVVHKAWKEAAALAQQVPHPAAYTPQSWRTYQETVLRLEQLTRAGYPKDHERLKALRLQAGDLAEKIRERAAVRRDALLNVALPMDGVLGLSPAALKDAERQQLHDVLRVLADPRVADADRKEWEAMKAAWKGRPDAALRAEMYRVLLQTLQDPDGAKLLSLVEREKSSAPPASSVVSLVQEASLRPAEVHLLIMLGKLVDPAPANSPPDELLRKALLVRARAEEAALASETPTDDARQPGHPYSEAVAPWFKADVEKADADRRLGEDLLFSSAKSDHATAAGHLDKALQGYQEVLKQARIVRDAIDARDRALADLPAYAQWVARQRLPRGPARPKKQDETERWGKDVERLAELAARISDALKEQKLPGLADSARQLRETHKQLRDYFATEARRLAQGNQIQEYWHGLEAILGTPLVPDPDERLKLLETSWAIAKKLHEAAGAGAGVEFLDDQEEVNVARQRQMAVAALRPFPGLVPPHPAEAHGKAGTVVGRNLVALPEAADAGRAEAITLAGPDRAAEPLRVADLQARGTWPGTASEPDAAPELLRRLRLHDLLLQQARRTLFDHWRDEREEPYFVTVAQRYAEDAGAILKGGLQGSPLPKGWDKPYAAVKDAIQPSGLAALAARKHFWTSERSFRLTWDLALDADPYLRPVGRPVYSLKVTNGTPAGSKPGHRQTVEPGTGKDGLAPITEGVLREKAPQVEVELSVLYRGQRLHPNDVLLARDPDLIVNRFEPPQEALVDVRPSKDFTWGAISIVVDYSGSMGFPYKTKDDVRFDYAVKALDKLLGQIPEGTELSVFAFYAKDPKSDDINFERMFDPKPWNRKLHQDDLLTALKDRATVLKWGSFTPLAKAIVVADKKGFRPGYSGPRLILALTDGDDTYSGEVDEDGKHLGENGQLWKRGEAKPLRRYLEEHFQKTVDRQVHVVCFLDKTKDARAKGEAERATSQFEFIQTKRFSAQGSFTLEPDANRLADQFARSLRPRVRFVDSAGNEPRLVGPNGITEDGIDVMPDNKGVTAAVRIPTGNYRAGVPYPTARDGVPVDLSRGDMLRISLRRNKDNRAILTREPVVRELEERNIRVITAQNPELPNLVSLVESNCPNLEARVLQQLVLVEDRPLGQAGANRLSFRQPEAFWIETAPADKAGKTGTLRFFREYGYPAVAYRALAGQWPTPDGSPVPAVTKAWTTYETGGDLWQTLPNVPLKGPPQERRLRFDKGKVEGVAREKFSVTTDPKGLGEADRQELECVVVRLAHKVEGEKDHDPRFLVELDAPYLGAEHLYYKEAGKYTAVFWGVNPALDTVTLRVLSLEALKQREPMADFGTVPANLRLNLVPLTFKK